MGKYGQQTFRSMVRITFCFIISVQLYACGKASIRGTHAGKMFRLNVVLKASASVILNKCVVCARDRLFWLYLILAITIITAP